MLFPKKGAYRCGAPQERIVDNGKSLSRRICRALSRRVFAILKRRQASFGEARIFASDKEGAERFDLPADFVFRSPCQAVCCRPIAAAAKYFDIFPYCTRPETGGLNCKMQKMVLCSEAIHSKSHFSVEVPHISVKCAVHS